jgi:uncharacterized membrane protein YqhA
MPNMVQRLLLGASRFLIAVAVICTLVAGTTLLIYGTALMIQIVVGIIQSGTVNTDVSKKLVFDFVEMVKLYLLSSVFYLIAGNLYEIFIAHIPLPKWLVIKDLDTLESKLVEAIIVMLGVLFLEEAITLPNGAGDLLLYGAGIALVIATLTYFVRQKSKSKNESAKEKG